jgi:hypothetical protein
MQFVKVGEGEEEEEVLDIPPPQLPDELFVNVQSVKVGEEE